MHVISEHERARLQNFEPEHVCFCLWVGGGGVRIGAEGNSAGDSLSWSFPLQTRFHELSHFLVQPSGPGRPYAQPSSWQRCHSFKGVKGLLGSFRETLAMLTGCFLPGW